MAGRGERYLTERILGGGHLGEPDQPARTDQTETRLETELRSLKSAYREVICLRAYCGMPYRRIADAMGLPSEATAKVLFLRARAELRNRL
jgi:DNA-directed RNA polymerase specialized sigma24 family protein